MSVMVAQKAQSMRMRPRNVQKRRASASVDAQAARLAQTCCERHCCCLNAAYAFQMKSIRLRGGRKNGKY